MELQPKCQVGESLTDCTQQIQDIVHDVYHRTILAELQWQKRQLYNQLKSWNFEQSQMLNQPSDIPSISFSPKTNVGTMYNAAKRDIANVLNVDSAAFNAEHNISKLLQQAIRSEIESQLDPNTLIVDHFDFEPDQIFDADSISDRIDRSVILHKWQDVRCWVVTDEKWVDISGNKGEIRLYEHAKSKRKYLGFHINCSDSNDQNHSNTHKKEEEVLSFQPLISEYGHHGISDIEHADGNQSAVIWEGCDWIRDGNHFTFCAKFASKSDGALFTKQLISVLASNGTVNIAESDVDSKEEFLCGPNEDEKASTVDQVSNRKNKKRNRRGRKKKGGGTLNQFNGLNGNNAMSDTTSSTMTMSDSGMRLKIQELEAEVQRLNTLRLESSNHLIASNGSNGLLNDAKTTKSSEFERQIKAKQSMVDKLRDQLKKSRSALESNKEIWNKKKVNLMTTVDEMNHQNKALKETIVAMETVQKTMKMENRKFQNTIKSLNNKMSKMSTKEELQALTKDFVSKIAECSDHLESEKAVNQELRTEIKEMKQREEEWKGKLDAMIMEKEEMKRDKMKGLDEMDAMKRRNLELNADKEGMMVEIERYKEQLKQIKSKLKAFENAQNEPEETNAFEVDETTYPSTKKKKIFKRSENVKSPDNGWSWNAGSVGKREEEPSRSSTVNTFKFNDEALMRMNSHSSSIEKGQESLPGTPSTVSSTVLGRDESVPTILKSWETKKVRYWDMTATKWRVLSKSSITIVTEIEGKLMIQIEDRNNADRVIFKHQMPSLEDARLVVDPKKKTAQWMVGMDIARNEEKIVVLVTFKAQTDVEAFSKTFNESS